MKRRRSPIRRWSAAISPGSTPTARARTRRSAAPATSTSTIPSSRAWAPTAAPASSCHQPAQAWGITPAEVQQRFDASDGTDPDLPPQRRRQRAQPADVVDASAQRRAAYSMLLDQAADPRRHAASRPTPSSSSRGRRSLHYASATELSLFRRPLPSTNLKFLATVMWDGRETVAPATPMRDTNLAQPATTPRSATRRRRRRLTTAQRQAIVDFETGAVHRADHRHATPAASRRRGARGGPVTCRTRRSTSASTTCSGADPRTRAPFRPDVFTSSTRGRPQTGDRQRGGPARDRARRGRCSTRAVQHHAASAASTTPSACADLTGTCTTCHDAPNAGNHSVALPLDIGLTDARRAHRRHAALHPAQQDHRRDHPDDRPGPRADHRQVGRHRQRSRGRSCAAWRRARRTSTTASRPPWPTSWTSTTPASTSGSTRVTPPI